MLFLCIKNKLKQQTEKLVFYFTEENEKKIK